MSPPTSSSGIASIRPLLRRAGLDEKEIEVYLALLSLQMARASDIAKVAKQSRSHTYLILRGLKEKGLISEIERGKIIHFVAESPEHLLHYLERREREYHELQEIAQGALPILESLSGPTIARPRVTFLSGREGIQQVYKEVLSQEYVGCFNSEAMYDAFGKNIILTIFGKDVHLHGRDLLVNNEAAQRYISEIEQHEGYEIRLLPKDVTFETDTIVFDDVIALFAYDIDHTIVRIENKNLANTFRSWFAKLWDVSSSSGSLDESVA